MCCLIRFIVLTPLQTDGAMALLNKISVFSLSVSLPLSLGLSCVCVCVCVCGNSKPTTPSPPTTTTTPSFVLGGGGRAGDLSRSSEHVVSRCHNPVITRHARDRATDEAQFIPGPHPVSCLLLAPAGWLKADRVSVAMPIVLMPLLWRSDVSVSRTRSRGAPSLGLGVCRLGPAVRPAEVLRRCTALAAQLLHAFIFYAVIMCG